MPVCRLSKHKGTPQHQTLSSWIGHFQLFLGEHVLLVLFFCISVEGVFSTPRIPVSSVFCHKLFGSWVVLTYSTYPRLLYSTYSTYSTYRLPTTDLMREHGMAWLELMLAAAAQFGCASQIGDQLGASVGWNLLVLNVGNGGNGFIFSDDHSPIPYV